MSVKVMRIATGEEEEELPDATKSAAAELGSRVESRLWSMEDVVALVDARNAKISGETMVG